MHDEVKKVLEQEAEAQPICTVFMDEAEHVSNDFVAILSRENGDASLFYNTDALTLGMSMKMVTRAFVDVVRQLPEEEQREIMEVIGESFVWDKPTEE